MSEEDTYWSIFKLHFATPSSPKLGVIRTLLDRKDAIVTEEEDKEEEEDKIKNVLNQCGYPKWAVEKVKKKKKNTDDREEQE